MTDQQTSRTNITEAPDVAAQVAYEMSVFLHGAEMAPPVAPGWLAKIREWQARLAAEPRSDAVTAPDPEADNAPCGCGAIGVAAHTNVEHYAVTAPDDCLNCGKPIAPTHCQACGECDPTPEARAASASVPPSLAEALDDWQNDFDEGWGDQFASGDFFSGGFSQRDHGDDHVAKEFRLLRAVRAVAVQKE